MLRGGRDRRRRELLPPPSAVVRPGGLTAEEVAVWEQWAPYAIAARTLTAGTAGDFADFCRLTVDLASVLTERRKEGWTTRGMFLAKEYRGLVQRVEGKRRAFRLAPIGKEIVPDAQPTDEWEEFDAPRSVQ